MAGDEETVASASAAFSLLANDQRMAILEALWDRRDPMPFSALREAVGIADSGQFNYHLGKLEGLYVRETGEGYTLTRPGRRVLTAVLAGDVLGAPTVDPTPVGWPCPHCGADVELRYEDEMLRVLCTECPGTFHGEVSTERERRENPRGTLSVLPIPPAGVEGRSPAAILQAAFKWIWHRGTMAASGLCPECSGAVVTDVLLCPDHDAEAGPCEVCGNRVEAIADVTCETCGHGMTTLLSVFVGNYPPVLAYFHDHGFDLADPDPTGVDVLTGYEEVVHARDPLDYELRWTFEGETLAVRVDADLDVVDVTRAAD